MSEYPNSGSLFRNDKRREGKNDPNATGKLVTTCEHCGEETKFWLSAWTKQNTNGPWQSISAKPKDGQKPNSVPQDTGAPFNDDIPF
jgi:hypothetical protein